MNLSEEKLIMEIRESQARIVKMMAEVEKISVEIRSEQRSTTKILMETFFYPFVAGTAFLGALLALLKVF